MKGKGENKMIAQIIRNIYFKFNYVLLSILAFALVFNGFNTINETFALLLVVGMLVIEMVIVIVVEFSEKESLFTKFLRRFASIDVLFAMLLIVFYIGACNNWLNAI